MSRIPRSKNIGDTSFSFATFVPPQRLCSIERLERWRKLYIKVSSLCGVFEIRSSYNNNNIHEILIYNTVRFPCGEVLYALVDAASKFLLRENFYLFLPVYVYTQTCDIFACSRSFGR